MSRALNAPVHAPVHAPKQAPVQAPVRGSTHTPLRRMLALSGLAIAFAVSWGAAGGHAQTQPATADTIYLGGPILTMEDDRPRVEAVAVANGRILALGSQAEILPLRSDETKVRDLQGRTMVPGFVDAHGHVYAVGIQALSANLLAPPDGEVQDIPTLTAELKSWAAANTKGADAASWIVGFGYDDSQLAEHRHPTREVLDMVSTDLPIYIIHQSGHLGVANTKALELGGITADSKDPPGGVIHREQGSEEPNGVLEENAHFEFLFGLLAKLDPAGAKRIFKAGMDLAASYGYTTVQEGRASDAQMATMLSLAEEEGLPVEVVAYPDALTSQASIVGKVSRDYTNRIRVGGEKLTIDGSPQGKTAWRDRPYVVPPAGQTSDYRGYAAASDEQTQSAVDNAFAKGHQVLVHANGEAAIDRFLAAVEDATAKYGPADRRTVLIHGQFIREDQLDRVKALGVFPSFFPMHTFYWGDWHREQTIGPRRVDDISPTGWARDRGMIFSTHHDAPVAFPDSMRVLDATVTRRSRSGDIIGPDQRVDVVTGLKAMTIWPAYQHFEEHRKGSIAVGKLADFVVLSDDPTAIDPETLDSLKVLETIKEDRSIFRQDAAGRKTD